MTAEHPILRRNARVVRHDGRVAVEYLTEEFSLSGAGAALLSRVAPLLDGKNSVGHIAEQTGEKPERVHALIDQLGHAGLLAMPADQHTLMTGEEFYKLHHRYAHHWLRPVYDHPLWEKIVSGKASRAQVLGFAYEKYHYIEGAYEHMAIGAANATPEMMPHLARHFIEEYTHGDIYRRGLRALFPDELVVHAQPLPSTRALINFLSESAARYSFGYYAGNEVLQMTENTSDEGASRSIDAFYDAMRRHYPWSGPLIDSFIAHTRADQRLGHEDAFWEMCKSVPPLTRREVKDAMNITRGMVEHLMLFMDGIDVHYATFPAVPRVPCTLLSE